MSATKAFLHDYNELHDSAWCALEEAIVAMNKLNDLIYNGDEIRSRVPRVDAALLMSKVKELQGEINCFDNAKEPFRLAPILPGELRIA